MIPTACPRCGFARAANGKCLRCGVFSPPPGAGRSSAAGPRGRGRFAGPGAGAAAAAPLRARIFRFIRWGVLALVCVILFLILRPRDPPPVQRDPEAPQRLEMKLRRAGDAHAAEGEAAVRLDESELNAWMSSAIDLEPAPEPATFARTSAPGRAPAGNPPIPALEGVPSDPTVEEVQSRVLDVRARLVGDQVVAYVLFDLYGKDLSLELQGRLSVQNGYLRLDPTALWIGSLPIPERTVQSAVERLFGDPESREKFRVPPGVKDIRVEDSQLVVVYQ